jgi:hypothetical protein
MRSRCSTLSVMSRARPSMRSAVSLELRTTRARLLIQRTWSPARTMR